MNNPEEIVIPRGEKTEEMYKLQGIIKKFLENDNFMRLEMGKAVEESDGLISPKKIALKMIENQVGEIVHKELVSKIIKDPRFNLFDKVSEILKEYQEKTRKTDQKKFEDAIFDMENKERDTNRNERTIDETDKSKMMGYDNIKPYDPKVKGGKDFSYKDD